MAPEAIPIILSPLIIVIFAAGLLYFMGIDPEVLYPENIIQIVELTGVMS